MTNAEDKQVLEKRTVAFSVQVLKILRRLPVGIESRNIKDQVAICPASSTGFCARERRWSVPNPTTFTPPLWSGTPRQAWLNYHDERNMNHKQTEM